MLFVYTKKVSEGEKIQATEQQKKQYIWEYERKEGIKTKIKKNPGLRSLANFLLNSFCGRFGQHDNMPQVELVKDVVRYFRLLTCQSTHVKNIPFVNDDCIELYYTQGDGFVSTSDKTNVVIAAFTTAHARLNFTLSWSFFSNEFCISIPIL